MSDMFFSSLIEMRDKVRRREISAKALTEAHLSRSRDLNPKLNAYTTFNEKAVQAAEKIDQMIQAGKDPGPLAGVPFSIKDMLCTTGLRTTAGSKMLHNFVPPYSATVVERLENAGAVVIGKANQDEFAMGSSNESSYFGAVKNPWSLQHVPGGSSGGSAAAVSAGLAAASIGTDTGGSIRQPANFCGIVGVKPTYGRVSRYGIVAFASSLDQAGPMTRTVADSAQIMEVICGLDERDSTTANQPVPAWSKQLSNNLKGLKVGLPKEYFSDEVSADTRKVVEQALKIVKDAGATTVEVSIPLTSYGVPIYYLIATSEASSNLARYDGVRFGHRADFSKRAASDLEEFYSRSRGEGFGAEVKRRIMLGTYALSSGYYDAFYRKAGQVRRLLRDQFLQAFRQCDVLLTPVTTSPAFKIGERSSNPLQMYLNDIYTTSTNLVGIPGMSVPGGFSSEGLPIGVQLSAAHFQEDKMLNVGFTIEQALNLTKKVPHGIQ
ncbi:MAG: Asp-tRNA(Asn)/Glu-tRNA(Gln) amidotransferase subunit GatA [Bdellovibrionales bacterium]